MNKNYYAVTAKFGHVGKSKFVIKTIPSIAEDGKKAAESIRWMGRVKHHLKDAIMSVNKITEEQYFLLKEQVDNDPYFHCHNVQEQRMKCSDIYLDLYSMKEELDDDKRTEERINRINYQSKKLKLKEYRDDDYDYYQFYDFDEVYAY